LSLIYSAFSHATPAQAWALISEPDRWALSYYVLALSAFKDPLTGQPIKMSQADRDALNDPLLKATESRLAYKSPQQDQPTLYAGEAWAKKHGFELAGLRAAKPASAADAAAPAR